MKKMLPVIGVAILLVLIVLGIRGGADAPDRQPVVLDPQTSDENGVSVTVIPSLGADWRFDVAMNTHSVDLGEDLAQVAVLRDDRENEYRPLRWEGGPPGGHHREGVLQFEPIAPLPAAITLEVVIGGTARNFSWPLN